MPACPVTGTYRANEILLGLYEYKYTTQHLAGIAKAFGQ